MSTEVVAPYAGTLTNAQEWFLRAMFDCGGRGEIPLWKLQEFYLSLPTARVLLRVGLIVELHWDTDSGHLPYTLRGFACTPLGVATHAAIVKRLAEERAARRAKNDM